MQPPIPPIELPDVLFPEFPSGNHDAPGKIRHFLHSRSDIIGAWLCPRAMEGQFEQGMLLVLVDGPNQGSEGIVFNKSALAVVLLDKTALEELLEEDDELVDALTKGYRVCGADTECFELEALALQIARGS